MKVYCQNCGSKIEYSVRDKPKFCHGCGTSLALGSNRSSRASQKGVAPENDNLDDDAIEVPVISELDVDIEIGEIAKESIENVIGTASGAASLDSGNEGNEISPEEFREQFQKEAGTLRNSSPPSE